MENNRHNPNNPKQPSHWENMQFILGRVGTQWLERRPGADEFDLAVYRGRYTGQRPYQDLSDFLFDDMKSCARTTEANIVLASSHLYASDTQLDRFSFFGEVRNGTPGIQHGFRVLGRILSFGVPAYTSLTGSFRTENDIDHLTTILQQPKSFDNTAGFIAKQMDTTYGFRPITAWEKRLHLLEDKEIEQQPGHPFIVNIDELNEVLDINPSWVGELESVPGLGCPARNVLLRKIWSHMIDMAADSQYLFPAELTE